MLKTVPGKKELKDGKKRAFRNPIFKHAESTRYQGDCVHGTGRYSCTKKILIKHREYVEGKRYEKAQVALNVWIGWLEACLSGEKPGGE